MNKEDKQYKELMNFINNAKNKKNNELRNKSIPFKSGRPARDTVITDEDRINLSIALNTTKSFEEFLVMV